MPAEKSRIQFEFAAAVNEALEMFPALEKSALFATTDGEILNRRALEFLPFPKSALAVLGEDIERSRRLGYSTANVVQGAALMVVYAGARETPDPYVDRYFSFDHELAHLLIEAARHPRLFPYIENVADAHAALRCIQRFGQRGRDYLRFKGWERASRFVAGDDDTHLSTLLIDRIVHDSMTEDFSGLSARETLARAVRYADEMTPARQQMAAAWNALGAIGYRHGEDSREKIALLAAAAAASPDPFTAYLGRRVAGAAKENHMVSRMTSGVLNRAYDI